jgi:hypothetical protein
MGYTHYYYLNNLGNESNYKMAKEAVRKIIKEKESILANGMGEAGTEPQIKEDIRFNGIEDESHETFYLPNKLSDLEQNAYSKVEGPFVFSCTKTARKDYDIVVVACLSVLKYYLGDDVKISSDGRWEELSGGHKLAEEILDKALPHPLDTTTCNAIRYIQED